MNIDFLQKLIDWPNYFISGTELRILLPGTEDARKAKIKRAVHKGYLQRIKKDHYIIKKIPNKPPVNSFEMAQFIYGPSYISLESALSYHGWIPEDVPVTCSASVKQTKSFQTPIGLFSFEKIPTNVFRLGVTHISEAHVSYLIADPWKAIADMIYCRKIVWKSIEDLILDLRIEEESIKSHPLDTLKELKDTHSHKPTRSTLGIFYNEASQWR